MKSDTESDDKQFWKCWMRWKHTLVIQVWEHLNNVFTLLTFELNKAEVN